MKRKLLFGLLIWGMLLIIYLPIFILVIFSFSEGPMSFQNFQFGLGTWSAFFGDRRLMGAVQNTVIVATVSALLAVIMGTVASVGIVRLRRRTQGVIMTMNQVPFINATIVTAVSLALFFATIGFISTGWLTLILAHTLICLPVVILIVLPRLRSLDKNLFEAAQDLGARPFYALFRVIIPQLMPAMITAFLLGFTLSLDDFIITQFNSGGVETISTYVYNASRRGVQPALRALSAFIFFFVVLMIIIINIRFSKQQKKKEEANR